MAHSFVNPTLKTHKRLSYKFHFCQVEFSSTLTLTPSTNSCSERWVTFIILTNHELRWRAYWLLDFLLERERVIVGQNSAHCSTSLQFYSPSTVRAASAVRSAIRKLIVSCLTIVSISYSTSVCNWSTPPSIVQIVVSSRTLVFLHCLPCR